MAALDELVPAPPTPVSAEERAERLARIEANALAAAAKFHAAGTSGGRNGGSTREVARLVRLSRLEAGPEMSPMTTLASAAALQQQQQRQQQRSTSPALADARRSTTDAGGAGASPGYMAGYTPGTMRRQESEEFV